MQSLISNKMGKNTPDKVITRRVVPVMAIYLLGIVGASPFAVSFTQLISKRIDEVQLRQWNEPEQLAQACRRQAGTRGPCSPPSPWG
ncbi:hypothetical protein ACE1CD_30195 [Aerosakkonema sp. BLCC-F183]|uniref:hypothetical protein n=1 Tax=Aerosakkonema sp. BLCC-F183 TaxID=3342834 RepID=UPI0035B8E586